MSIGWRPWLIPCSLLGLWSCGLVLELDKYEQPGAAVATTASTGGAGSGAAGGGGDDTSGGAGGGAGGDAGGFPDCGGLSVLSDNFAAGAVAPGWNEALSTGATFTHMANEATASVPLGTVNGRAIRTTVHHHDMTDDAVVLEVVDVPSAGGVAFLSVRSDAVSGSWLSMETDGVDLMVKASPAMMLGSVPYDPVAHRFWRISEQAGVVAAEAAETASGPWVHRGSTQMPFEPRYTLVRYGLTADNLSLGDSAVFGSLRGGATPKQGWCPSETLSDAFDDNITGDLWKASALTSCTAFEQGGELRLIVDGVVGCEYRSSAAYDLRGSSYSIKLRQGAMAPQVLFARLWLDDQNFIKVEAIPPTTFSMVERIEGNDTTRSLTLSPGQDWWRFREEDGELIFETSADGSSWSELVHAPSAIALDALKLGFGLTGDVGAEGIFSELNTASP